MSLLHTHMLRRDVKVAHSPLQRRALIKRTAAAGSKACIDDTNAGRGDPNRQWRHWCQESLIVQRSGKCMVPMIPGLDLAKCRCRPESRCGTDEIGSKCCRSPHRHGGPLLL